MTEKTDTSSAHGLSIADRLSLPRIHWGWLLLLIGFGVLFWASRAVLGPFIAGFIVAYLLDPPATRLERAGWPRWLAAVSVLVVFVAALVGLALASAPILQSEVLQLIERLPKLIADLQPLLERLMREANGAADVKAVIGDLGGKAAGWASNAFGSIIAGGLAFVNVVTFMVITPVVAFYLLRDWAGIVAHLDSWWPRRQAATVRQLLADSDKALSGFVRGQSLVCMVLAVFYAVGWSLVGLDYAIVLGLLAGVFGFVPFIGVLVAVGLSVLVALGQFGLDWLQLGLVVGVFVIGQMLEGSVLTPNLIGNRIGLHPVWVLFAVFAGGAVAGIVGVFLAVPVAAVLGVIVRSALQHYRTSDFYGPEPEA